MRVVLLAFGTSCAISFACGGEIDTKYGPPNGLRGQTNPQPTTTGTGNPPPSGNDAGAPIGDGGGDSSSQACPVSWKTQVFPIFETNGNGQCGKGGCHAAGGQSPTITDNDPNTTYANLKAWTQTGAKPYIATTGNPADSAIECNLQINGATLCGAQRMPQNITLPQTDLDTIDKWVKCGAPNN